jgi:hypothetical protein
MQQKEALSDILNYQGKSTMSRAVEPSSIARLPETSAQKSLSIQPTNTCDATTVIRHDLCFTLYV